MRTSDPASLASDYLALRTAAAVVDLSTWTSLRVTGPDARSFLQGLATQDLDPACAGPASAPTAATTLFLSERGRPVALAWVSFDPSSGSALVLADDGARAALRAHLDRFHVMEDVEIEGPLDRRILGFAGPSRRDHLRRFAAGAGEALETFESAPLSFALLPAAAASPPGFDFVAPGAFEAWRLSVGLPRTGIDLDPDRIATELGLEEAISHTKGCFVGQEVVARTSNRGQVKRSRVGFRFPAGGSVLEPRTEIRAKGAPAGYVTSSALEPGTGDGLGMGYLSLDAQLGESAPTAVRGGVEVPIRPAPWPL